MAILEYSKPFRSVNYMRIVAFSPNSLRAFFYHEIISIRYCTTMKSSPLITSIQEVCLSFRTLLRRLEVMISFVSAIGRNSYKIATSAATYVMVTL